MMGEQVAKAGRHDPLFYPDWAWVLRFGRISRLCTRGWQSLQQISRSLFIKAFDFDTFMKFGDHLGLRPLNHIMADLFLDRIKRRECDRALLLNLDDVPAELGFYRV